MLNARSVGLGAARDALVAVGCEVFQLVAAWEPGAGSDGAAHRRWVNEFSVAIAPFALPGGYANLLGPDDHGQVAAAYGTNANRLRDLKRRFDPDNLFSSAIPLPW